MNQSPTADQSLDARLKASLERARERLQPHWGLMYRVAFNSGVEAMLTQIKRAAVEGADGLLGAASDAAQADLASKTHWGIEERTAFRSGVEAMSEETSYLSEHLNPQPDEVDDATWDDLRALLDDPDEPTPEPENAVLVISYKGEHLRLVLEGTELSEVYGPAGGVTGHHMSNASQAYISERVEEALLHLAHQVALPKNRDLEPVVQPGLVDAAEGVDPVRDALAMLVLASDDGIPSGGTLHALEGYVEGDGWNEPHHQRYSCPCGEWSMTWTQTDPECIDQPDPVDVALSWREHYLASVLSQTDTVGGCTHHGVPDTSRS